MSDETVTIFLSGEVTLPMKTFQDPTSDGKSRLKDESEGSRKAVKANNEVISQLIQALFTLAGADKETVLEDLEINHDIIHLDEEGEAKEEEVEDDGVIPAETLKFLAEMEKED